ncbi:glycosyltransferase family 4 protein [bacterium]|nr:glycosyltransferase family 4 protein [candidate division CSSED10-310 bacterium]
MKILFVVQRFGRHIMGGAELHCRLMAKHLANLHEVEIATTCAADYLTWENVLEPGRFEEDGLTVHRFPVLRQRPRDFDILAFSVLHGFPSAVEEEHYLDAHGPVCPALIQYLESRNDIDRFILFSYRYWTTWKALITVGHRSILVPTAENDRTLYLNIHRASFLRPAAIAYNSVEERNLIHRVSGNQHVPGVTVGVGLADSRRVDPGSDPLPDMPGKYFLYIGRIEESKGCQRLITDFIEYYKTAHDPAALVFLGKGDIPIPDHPGIFQTGMQPDEIKIWVLSRALALVMPSRYESLSMVLLEAWEQFKPVIVNASCDVLLGQCIRSGGGLYYRNTDEFIEVLDLMAATPDLREKLGRQGHAYYQRNYAWPIILEKYQKILTLEGDIG